jgi:mannose/fructose/N-acetylgalactosamine-specific phosphotransferase system component IIC
MIHTLHELLLLVLLGGLVALDGTALGQFMVSRPLVAATLAGGLLGDPMSGLVVGGVLELFYLSVLPVGGARFPEGGPAAVVGAATAAAAPEMAGLVAGVSIGLAWGALGGLTVGWLRRLNTLIALDPEGPAVTPSAVARVQAACVGMDLARGVVLTGLGALVGPAVAAWLGAHWPLDGGWSAGLLLLGAAVPMGALLRSFGLRPFLLAGGLAAGLLLGGLA